MAQLRYTQEELEAETEGLQPHIECGLTLHGGFDNEGQYVSPRTRN